MTSPPAYENGATLTKRPYEIAVPPHAEAPFRPQRTWPSAFPGRDKLN